MDALRSKSVLKTMGMGILGMLGMAGTSGLSSISQKDYTFSGFSEEEMREHTKKMTEKANRLSLRNSVKPGCQIFYINGQNIMAINYKNALRKAGKL